MRQLSLFILGIILLATASAQTTDNILAKNKAYTGAKPIRKNYRAIYQLDNSDPKSIEKAIRNINNALTDPRLAGKIQIEMIAFSGGTDAYMKGSKYEEDIKALAEKGVIVAQCGNTLRERKISIDQIYDFIAVVPSANGELIIRAAEGWIIIKP
ncbi:MAG: DsrE family protein [Bacteroidetes bacterium]|nr:DsrE family protein [Bacteroidota bacterium]